MSCRKPSAHTCQEGQDAPETTCTPSQDALCGVTTLLSPQSPSPLMGLSPGLYETAYVHRKSWVDVCVLVGGAPTKANLGNAEAPKAAEIRDHNNSQEKN